MIKTYAILFGLLMAATTTAFADTPQTCLDAAQKVANSVLAKTYDYTHATNPIINFSTFHYGDGGVSGLQGNYGCYEVDFQIVDANGAITGHGLCLVAETLDCSEVVNVAGESASCAFQ